MRLADPHIVYQYQEHKRSCAVEGSKIYLIYYFVKNVNVLSQIYDAPLDTARALPIQSERK